MYVADDLLKKLKEIESLIRDNIHADGSCGFDADRIYLCLELACRMFDKSAAD